jgi:uncharacterized protein DUF4128
MASPEENIENALFSRAAGLTALTGLPVFWPNVGNNPPSDGRYLAVSLLPNHNDRFLLAGNDPHYRQGILQVNVMMPRNAGQTPSTQIAGQVASHFPADLALFSEDVKVKLQKVPDVMSALSTDAAWMTPVSVYYEAFV